MASCSCSDLSLFPTVQYYQPEINDEFECPICLEPILQENGAIVRTSEEHKIVTTSCACTQTSVVHEGCFADWAQRHYFVDAVTGCTRLMCLTHSHVLMPGVLVGHLPTYRLSDEDNDNSSDADSFVTACSTQSQESKKSEKPFRLIGPLNSINDDNSNDLDDYQVVRKVGEVGEMLFNFGTGYNPDWKERVFHEMHRRFGVPRADRNDIAEWKLDNHCRYHANFGEHDDGDRSVLLGYENDSDNDTDGEKENLFLLKKNHGNDKANQDEFLTPEEPDVFYTPPQTFLRREGNKGRSGREIVLVLRPKRSC